MAADEPVIPGVDLTRANVARMYDYLLGGGHHLAVDRELADRFAAADPTAAPAARELRSFLRRVVEACLERGVDQFLDLGSGIPTVGNVHEIAQRRTPSARVAYVDNEPVAVCHGQELLRDVEGATTTLADICDPDAVLGAPTVTDTLDFGRPVAVLMLAVLHFVPGRPGDLVRRYREVLAPGSALAISHGSADWDDPALAARRRSGAEVYRNSAQPATLRDRDEITALFDGTQIVAPGIVDVSVWRPDTSPGPPAGAYGGLGFVAGPQP